MLEEWTIACSTVTDLVSWAERVARVRLLRGVISAVESQPGIREEAPPTRQLRVGEREKQKELRERAAPGRERGSCGVEQRQQRQLVGQRGVGQESGERRWPS